MKSTWRVLNVQMKQSFLSLGSWRLQDWITTHEEKVSAAKWSVFRRQTEPQATHNRRHHGRQDVPRKWWKVAIWRAIFFCYLFPQSPRPSKLTRCRILHTSCCTEKHFHLLRNTKAVSPFLTLVVSRGWVVQHVDSRATFYRTKKVGVLAGKSFSIKVIWVAKRLLLKLAIINSLVSQTRLSRLGDLYHLYRIEDVWYSANFFSMGQGMQLACIEGYLNEWQVVINWWGKSHSIKRGPVKRLILVWIFQSLN